MNFHEINHINKLLQQQGSVRYIFNEFTRNVSSHLTGWVDYPSGDLWSRNRKVEEAIDSEIAKLRNKLTVNIENYTHDSWNRGHLKADELVNGYIKNLAISEVVQKGMYARNAEAFNKFMERKIDGLTLSNRVWNLTNGTKENIEFYLQSGLSTGRPAAKISQDIRQLLKEPDRRFHRIMKNGKLVPSQPMKDYHPGRGIYKSSYKNALRLAITNTNEMYRTVDNERWNKLDFVLGYRVQRSANNYGQCVICDPMAGDYPKNFLFVGWHPQCICISTPILMEEEDFIKYLTGTRVEDKTIQGVPENFNSYMKINGEKLSNMKNQPYWLSKNKDFLKGESAKVKGQLVNPALKESTIDNSIATSKKTRQQNIEYGNNNEWNIENITDIDLFDGFDLQEMDLDIKVIEAKYPGLKFTAKEIDIEGGRISMLGRYDGERISLTRYIDNSENGKIASHAFLDIPSKHQGEGVGKDILKMFLKQYENAEIKTIMVRANAQVGGYAWAKYGFEMEYKDALKIIGEMRTKGKLTENQIQIASDIISSEAKKYGDNFTHFNARLWADLPFGKDMLLGTSWTGRIGLNNARQMEIFKTYINTGK